MAMLSVQMFSEQFPYTLLFPALFLFPLFLYKLLFPKRCSQPPSPPKFPILGHLHLLGRHPHRSLQALSGRHGNLMLLHLGSKPVLVVSSSKTARLIMKTHDALFSDRPQLSVYKKLFYGCKNVAAAPYGEYWRQIRSICVLQLLSSKRVQSFKTVRDEELALMMAKITESSEQVDLSDIFLTFTNNLICKVAFGMRLEGDARLKELMEVHEELLGGFYVGEFIPWLGWVNHLNGVASMVDKNAEEMDECLERIVNQHLKELRIRNGNNDEKEHEGQKTETFMDVLIAAGIERESIKAVTSDMFVAGTTTTFATLEWAMSELLRHPEIIKKLQREVRGVMGDKPDITDDDLEKMKYLKAVINETFRLHPAVPLLLPRQSTQRVNINGYNIVEGTQVIINAWAIHRDPEFWEDPESFWPERFLDSKIDFKGQDFNLIPFGGGRRGCPGILFGMTNIEHVLANLMHKFNWSITAGEPLNMEEYPGLTIHRKIPLRAVANRCNDVKKCTDTASLI